MKKKLSKAEIAKLREETEYFLWLLETCPVSADWKINLKRIVTYWRGVADRRPTKEFQSVHDAVQREYEKTCFSLYRDGELF